MKPSYDLFIPGHVYHDDLLSLQTKVLYGEIRGLCKVDGFCWATNRHFAERLQATERTIRRWLSQLEKRHHIRVNLTNNSARQIYLSESTPRTRVSTPRTRASSPTDTGVHNPGHGCPPNTKEDLKQQTPVVDVDRVPEDVKREFSSAEAIRQYCLDCGGDIDRMRALISQAKMTGRKNPVGAAIAAARGGYELAQADPETLCSISGCREPFHRKTSAGGEIVRLCEGHYTEYRTEFPDGGPYMGLFIKNYQKRSCKDEIAV